MEKIQEVIDILNKLQDEGYIKVLNWETRELILRPRTTEHIVDPLESVSYTHLTLPTKRIV